MQITTPAFTPRPERERRTLSAQMVDQGYSLCEAFGCRHVVAPPVTEPLVTPKSFCGKHQLASFCELNLICGTIVGKDDLLHPDSRPLQPHMADMFNLVVSSFQGFTPAELGAGLSPDVTMLLSDDDQDGRGNDWLRIQFPANQKFSLEQTKVELELRQIVFFIEDTGVVIPLNRESTSICQFAEAIARWFEQNQLKVERLLLERDFTTPGQPRIARGTKKLQTFDPTDQIVDPEPEVLDASRA
jgi:hypothetical protein